MVFLDSHLTDLENCYFARIFEVLEACQVLGGAPSPKARGPGPFGSRVHGPVGSRALLDPFGAFWVLLGPGSRVLLGPFGPLFLLYLVVVVVNHYIPWSHKPAEQVYKNIEQVYENTEQVYKNTEK